jgi:hypothetical protein
MPVMFPFETIMVEFPATEVSAMVSFETAMIVFIVYPVAIVAVPFRIAIVGVTRIVSFKVYVDVYLGAGGLNGQ